MMYEFTMRSWNSVSFPDFINTVKQKMCAYQEGLVNKTLIKRPTFMCNESLHTVGAQSLLFEVTGLPCRNNCKEQYTYKEFYFNTLWKKTGCSLFVFTRNFPHIYMITICAGVALKCLQRWMKRALL